MSEKIKITIVIENTDKQTAQKHETAKNVEVTHDISMTLMSTLQKKDLILENFCGGIGKCGRCLVQFEKAAPLPTPVERSLIPPKQLREGFRLACMTRPKNTCVIRLAFRKQPSLSIVTDVMKVSEANDCLSQCKEACTQKEQKKKETLQAIKEDKSKCYIVAVDLGTTTIAMQLRELYSGHVEATYCEQNPQRKFGADVLSRIREAEKGYAEEMKASVWQVLQNGMEQFRQYIPSIVCICIAGNTTMEHLMMGLPVASLGKSPFTPVRLDLQQTQFSTEEVCNLRKAEESYSLPVYVLPGISTFVGGDIVAGLYCCNLFTKDRQNTSDVMMPVKQRTVRKAILFLDLGTNGEMALTDGTRMLVTATAAGPAFEGGAGANIPGSDMVAMTAFLLNQKIMDTTGLLQEPYFTEGIYLSYGDKTAVLGTTQQNIRDIQMAKAAVCAGVEILWEQMGRPEIQKVYLAGGFGYYLDVQAALRIGLLPEAVLWQNQGENHRVCTAEGKAEAMKKIQAVGNTSLAGAYLMGRDLYTGKLDGQKLEKLLRGTEKKQDDKEEANTGIRIESINLAAQDRFEGLYLSHLNFTLP